MIKLEVNLFFNWYQSFVQSIYIKFLSVIVLTSNYFYDVLIS
jgi:hypothetical protein